MNPAALSRLIERHDWFRRPPARVGGRVGFKEWMHFCVHAPGLDLLVNFSEVDDVRPGSERRPSLVRQTLLLSVDRWLGGVERVPDAEAEIVGGSIRARLGEAFLRFEDGRYQLRAQIEHPDLEVEVELTPESMPVPVYNVAVGDGPPIHWLIIPRLRATGSARAEDRVHTFVDVPAYHDHNWGFFRWGRDFAWDWGFALPQQASNPWSFVFARLDNRSHTRTRMQTAFLWRGPHVAQAFRDAQLEFVREGLFRPQEVLTVPPVMALIATGSATDIPARLHIHGRAGQAHFRACFVPDHVARVVVPNDDDLGVTIIHEVTGRFELEGRVGDEELILSCRTTVEFLGA